MNKGATDRHRQYTKVADDYFSCTRGEPLHIIRSIGSLYLALAPGDRWLLVSGDCEVKFHLGELRDGTDSNLAGRSPPM